MTLHERESDHREGKRPGDPDAPALWKIHGQQDVCIDLMKITKVETSIILFNQGTHHAKNSFTTGLLGGFSIGWREDSL